MDSQKDVHIISIDINVICLYVNKYYHDVKLKLSGADYRVGVSILEAGADDKYLQKSLPYYRRALSGESIRVVEEYDSPYLAIEASYNPMYSEAREIIGATVFSVDITERRQAEDALGKGMALMDAVFSSQSIAILVYDKDMYVQRANDAFRENFGFDPMGLNVREIIERVNCRDMDGTSLRLAAEVPRARAVAGFRAVDVEYIVRKADETDAIVEVSENPLIFDGDTIGSVAMWHDITTRKRAETDLKESEANLKALIENTEGSIWSVDADYRLIVGNSHFRENVRVATGKDPSQGDDILSVNLPSDHMAKWRAYYDRAFRGESFVAVEKSRYSNMGKSFEYRFGPIRGQGGAIVGVTVAGHDITARLEDAERIMDLLNEKVLFIKEIHHRVKNNMNTVSSLLSYQAELQTALETRQILADASRRVGTMGLLYDKVYRATDTRPPSLDEFLPDILSQIVGLFPKGAAVDVGTQIENIVVSDRLMTPLGIIIYELVSNSMKYAFPGDRSGRISLTVGRLGNRARIEYSDDGIGLPDDVDIGKSKGFGFQLLEVLIGQMGGTVSIRRSPGTAFTIDFDPGTA